MEFCSCSAILVGKLLKCLYFHKWVLIVERVWRPYLPIVSFEAICLLNVFLLEDRKEIYLCSLQRLYITAAKVVPNILDFGSVPSASCFW